MVKVRNNEELKDAMKRGDSTIEIEGDFARKVIRLKATGNVSWLIAFAAICVVVLVVITAAPTTVATGGLGVAVDGVIASAAFAPATAIVGFEVAVMAVGLAVAAGGVGILTRLRSGYKGTSKNTIFDRFPDL